MTTFLILDTPPDGARLEPETQAGKLQDVVPDDVTILKRDMAKDAATVAKRIRGIVSAQVRTVFRSFKTENAGKFATLAKARDRVVVFHETTWDQYLVA